jgi:hypothetical protein
MRQRPPHAPVVLDAERELRPFAQLADWRRYARWLRTNARVSLGLLPNPPGSPLKGRVFGRWEGDGFSCEKVHFEALPGLLVTGNLYRPAGRPGRRGRPAILCPHGHWADGRLHDHDPAGSVPARCIQLACMGFVVFSWDMVGYNDSCQLPHRAFRADDPHWGLSLMALQTLSGVRALDFVAGLPDVDPRRIGVTGASGGATQTLALLAVDDRVAAAAPICMISARYQGGCLCENAPLLRIHATNVDMARLFAPRSLFVGSCTGDWTADTPEVELPAIREVYALHEAADRVSGLHVDAGHNYNRQMREAVYGFFNHCLLGAESNKPVPEPDWSIERPPLPDRMVWWGRKAPAAMSAATLRDIWRGRCEAALKPHLKNAESARRGLGPLLPHVLAIGPDGRAGRASQEPQTIRVEAGTDSVTIAPCGRLELPDIEFPLTYNPSPLARRVHEILGVIEKTGGRRELIGKGAAGPACLLAAALSKRVKTVTADLGSFDPENDRSWRRSFDTPSICQIGGLATIFALIGPRPLHLPGAPDAVRRLARRYAR